MFSANNKFAIFIFIAFSVCTDMGLAAVAKDLESIDMNNADDRVDKDMMEIEGKAGPIDLIQGIVELFTSILSSNPLLTSETTTMSSDIVDYNESSTSNNGDSNGTTEGYDKENNEQTEKETSEATNESERDSCPPS